MSKAPEGAGTVPALLTFTDDQILAYIGAGTHASLAGICGALGLPYMRPRFATRVRSDWRYTPEAKQVRNALQRLRLRGLIQSSAGQRWEVTEQGRRRLEQRTQ